MKTHLKKSLELLDKYLKETPKNIVEKELSFYDNLDFEGLSFNGYVELFSIDLFNQFNSEYINPEPLNDFAIDCKWLSVFSSCENEVIYSHQEYAGIKQKSCIPVKYSTKQYELEEAA